jgi:hypothetical protein
MVQLMKQSERNSLVAFLCLFCLSHISCSAVTNTISGLTTPQSTISGSNYLFLVDQESKNVVKETSTPTNSQLIRAGDHFKVSLDFGFMRYLQAVDPYVIVYSESWMGDSPKPTDPKLTHRQIALSKDGLTPNANLPIHEQSLLGPVTQDQGNHDVHVTVKIVVLSKHDNEETISLLNNLAGAAAAAAPQSAPLSGAVAELGAAVVSQNKDKIEFEHTFTFTGTAGIVEAKEKHSRLTLQEGTIVVVKGESEFRVVPYQHWGYYAWPFNWFGQIVDPGSQRFEVEPADLELNYGTVLWFLVRVPYYLLNALFIAPQWEMSDKGTFPTDLTLAGKALYCQSKDKDKFIPTGREVNLFFKIGRHERCPSPYPYHQKTHMVFRIDKSDSSLGTFNEVVTKFSPHGDFINKLATTSTESRAISNDRLVKAFDATKNAIIYERTKRKILDRSRQNDFDTVEDISKLPDGITADDKKALVEFLVDRRIISTIDDFLAFARAKVKDAETVEESKKNPQLLKVFPDLVSYIQLKAWKLDDPVSKDAALGKIWIKGWKQVLDKVQSDVYNSSRPEVRAGFSVESWKTLYALVGPIQEEKKKVVK